MPNQIVRVNKKSTGCCRRCLLGTCVYILVLLLLLFVTIFVIVPVAFKYSVGIQRTIIFPTFLITANQNYSNIDNYHIGGVRNFYVDVKHDNKTNETVSLGIWQILPQEMLSNIVENHEYNFDGALANEKYNILIYLHGNGHDRTGAVELYGILRNYFHIFAVDYRGYADSTKADMKEEYIVDDVAFFYKWLKHRSKSNIFVWGHSLGTGVGTHLLSNLKKENITAAGLILETPFTSVTDVIKTHPIYKVYSFLPWCKATFLDPFVDNGMDFNSKKYILNVDCPIMILHAKDDTIIEFEIATKLYNIVVNNRNNTYQGNVTYHLYEALGYDHMYIYRAPELPHQVSEFIKECNEFAKKKNLN